MQDHETLLQNGNQVASVNKRAASFMIDDIVISLLFFAIFYDQLVLQLGTLPVEGEVGVEMMMGQINHFISENILSLLLLKLLYHTIFIWQMGKTLGKYVMKIKVVELQSEQNPTFNTALIRALLRLPSELFLYIGFLIAFFSPLKQTFHDKYSRCVVVDG